MQQPLGGPYNDRIIAQTLGELQPQIHPQPVRLAGIKTVLGGILVIVLLMACGGTLVMLTQGHHTSGPSAAVVSQSDRVQSQVEQLQVQNRLNVAIASKLADQLRQNGIKPSATPLPALSVTPAPMVTLQAPPLTNVQIQKALQSCWAVKQCDAKPTPTQLVAAFQTYCGVDGRCRGPAGRDVSYAPTSNEPSGPLLGQQSRQVPGPTDEQVLAAVTTYCSSGDNCRGYPSAIIIEVPNPSITDPSRVRRETCAPSSPGTDHIYTCQ